MYLEITQGFDITSTLSTKFVVMAAITYASFPDPRFPDDEPSSPTIHPLEQLSLMDGSTVTSTPIIDLDVVDISDLAAEDEDCVAGFTHDCADIILHHLLRQKKGLVVLQCLNL